MSRAAVLEAIAIEWPKAVEDSGLSESDLALWKTESTPGPLRDVAAQYFVPVQDPDPPYGFSREQFAEAISPELYERHRITIHLDYRFPDGLSIDEGRALLGALLRHELEHARQQAAVGTDLLALNKSLVEPAMGHMFGGGIPGLYVNCAPIELDANAASASFLRRFHPEHMEAIAATGNANLTRIETEPQPFKTLVRRTIAFLFVFQESAESLGAEMGIRHWLALYSKDAVTIWDQLSYDGDPLTDPDLREP